MLGFKTLVLLWLSEVKTLLLFGPYTLYHLVSRLFWNGNGIYSFPLDKSMLFTYLKVDWSFHDGSMDKESPCDAGDTRDPGLIPGSGISPGEGNSNPLQHLAWEIPWTEDPGGLQSKVQRVTKSQTGLSMDTSWSFDQRWI